MTTTSIGDDLDGSSIDAGCGICDIFGLLLGDVGESRLWRRQEWDLSLHRKRLVPLHRSLAGAS